MGKAKYFDLLESVGKSGSKGYGIVAGANEREAKEEQEQGLFDDLFAQYAEAAGIDVSSLTSAMENPEEIMKFMESDKNRQDVADELDALGAPHLAGKITGNLPEGEGGTVGGVMEFLPGRPDDGTNKGDVMQVMPGHPGGASKNDVMQLLPDRSAAGADVGDLVGAKKEEMTAAERKSAMDKMWFSGLHKIMTQEGGPTKNSMALLQKLDKRFNSQDSEAMSPKALADYKATKQKEVATYKDKIGDQNRKDKKADELEVLKQRYQHQLAAQNNSAKAAKATKLALARWQGLESSADEQALKVGPSGYDATIEFMKKEMERSNQAIETIRTGLEEGKWYDKTTKSAIGDDVKELQDDVREMQSAISTMEFKKAQLGAGGTGADAKKKQVLSQLQKRLNEARSVEERIKIIGLIRKIKEAK